MVVSKQHGIAGLIVLAASVVTSAGTLWGFTERVFAGEIKEQLAPVIQTQKILLISDIESRRLGIVAMEYKRDMCRSADPCWTIRDAQDLTRARSELTARETALAALEK